MTNRILNRSAVAVGLIALFFFIQYDFDEDKAWTTWSLPLSGKVILLDPGHGGIDAVQVINQFRKKI